MKYDGYCYNVINDIVNQIKKYTETSIVVTGILYGPPEWARVSCTNEMQIFCTSKDADIKDYGRFVGFFSWFFNRENGHGRVTDFVIHNEVNSAEWFNYGVSLGNYDVDTWITLYKNNFNIAYDYERKEQKQAKVLISFEHYFDSSFDIYFFQDPERLSVVSFLLCLLPKLGGGEWRLAFHVYPVKDTFDIFDYPFVTFGNIGILASWLRQTYPNSPYVWEMQLTENGLNYMTKQ